MLLLTSQPGFAADDAGSAGLKNLEEVVVTAQKRAERAQGVPISLAAMSGEALESSHDWTASGLCIPMIR